MTLDLHSKQSWLRYRVKGREIINPPPPPPGSLQEQFTTEWSEDRSLCSHLSGPGPGPSSTESDLGIDLRDVFQYSLDWDWLNAKNQKFVSVITSQLRYIPLGVVFQGTCKQKVWSKSGLQN